jgi:hypothetical protein
VWRWNRAIYDPALGGHLRIEMRALPAGPTLTDMLANAAFLVGLSWWLAEQDPDWTYRLSFERAEHGFYRAAQHGLAAELTWPFGQDGRLRTLPAANLIPELLPATRNGLVAAGVAATEADHLLGGHRRPSGRRANRRAVAASDAGHPGAAAWPPARADRDARALPGICRHRPAGPHLAHQPLNKRA